MSLRSISRASIAPRSIRGGATWITCRSRTGVGRITQKRWASDDKKGEEAERPFYFQLQESIYDRVQKEKAEQIRIQAMQQRTARGQFFAAVTGTFPFDIKISCKIQMLMSSSMSCFSWYWLLLWPIASTKTSHKLYLSSRRHSPSKAQHFRSEYGGGMGRLSRYCWQGEYFA